ncbi:hypothetical protein H310_14974 [Aphanomyces invadans]|uniref:HAT C-terminal dimerisation domain-containing protein n=1 Tax=Aphanomyces invadans TaxID=157072 RepID=A0A024TA07_9STRA|nr:hypothetical protein H310_14974 [Aphanomyces invadans]ETV90192.1 hypothetical protein H310_14974 [Aphanomyces invadans]|eukprot:XP_008881176.1 hypothetical protein H310_14974 [Aphanomyces invadans]
MEVTGELVADSGQHGLLELVLRLTLAGEPMALAEATEKTNQGVVGHDSLFGHSSRVEGNKTVLQYWLVDGKYWPELRQIAFKLFSMATSSAASERNWSIMGFIHSNLRNR